MESMDFTDATFVSDWKPLADGRKDTCLTHTATSGPKVLTFMLPRSSTDFTLNIVGDPKLCNKYTTTGYTPQTPGDNTFRQCDIGTSFTDLDGHHVCPLTCTCHHCECSVVYVQIYPPKWGPNVHVCEVEFQE